MSLRDRLLRWLVPQHDRAGIPRGHPGHAINQLKRLHVDDNKPVIVPVTDYRTSLRAIANPDFCRSQRYREQQGRASREGVHPDILHFSDLLIGQLRKANVPFFPHCYIRSADEQDRLKAQGFSKAAGGQSPHNYGLAVDAIHSVKGWEITPQSWALVGHIGKELAARNGIAVEWGGDWKKRQSDIVGWDPAHWQLQGWKALAGL